MCLLKLLLETKKNRSGDDAGLLMHNRCYQIIKLSGWDAHDGLMTWTCFYYLPPSGYCYSAIKKYLHDLGCLLSCTDSGIDIGDKNTAAMLICPASSRLIALLPV